MPIQATILDERCVLMAVRLRWEALETPLQLEPELAGAVAEVPLDKCLKDP
jgi:hypothetical protein